MTHDEAELLAISALQHLAGDEEELGRFLALTGLGVEELREAAQSQDFLSGVLDHFLGNEPTLLAFAAAAGIDPRNILKAREILSHAMSGQSGRG